MLAPLRLRHIGACVVVALVAGGCRHGDDDVTPEQVKEAFAENGIRLTEVTRLPEGSLWVVLGPSSDTTKCPSEDLRVNVFRRSGDVADYLRRRGLDSRKSSHVLESDTGTAIGFVHENLLAAVSAQSRCFSEAQVASALGALSRGSD